jgi:hypothetical protein
MPLIVLSGQPCSGKSTVAAQLTQMLQSRGIASCNLVDEPSLHLIRDNAYRGEKTHARTHTHPHTNTNTHTHIHIHTHTYTRTYTHTHTPTHIRKHIHTHTHTNTHTHARTHTCMLARSHAGRQACAHAHECAHASSHTSTAASACIKDYHKYSLYNVPFIHPTYPLQSPLLNSELCSLKRYQTMHTHALGCLNKPSFADVPSEKNTRALLKSTVERFIGRKGVTILDSLNNIKVRPNMFFSQLVDDTAMWTHKLSACLVQPRSHS